MKRLKFLSVSLVVVAIVAFTVPSEKYFDIAKSLDIFATLFKEVNAYYVDDVNPKKLVETGINGMLNQLDPYTDYIPEEDLEALLASDVATRADLAVALERLRKEVDERRATEDALRRTEQENFFLIKEQRQIIAAMSTPIIQVWQGILTVPIVGQIGAARAATLMQQLLDAIVTRSARHAILDLTGVDYLDAETADHILRIVHAAELLGAKAIVSGIRPRVAQTIVELGVDLASLATAANLEEGLKACLRAMGVRVPMKAK